MKRSLLLAAVLAAAGAAAWLLVARGNRPPNVLLISIDTLRRDHVSAYGYGRPTTPGLDRLAAEGALFTDAWSVSSWTLPSHISALTGLPPSVHGVEGQRDRLAAGITTLAEVLDREGFATAGFVSHVYLDPQYGFARGFQEYVTQPVQTAEDVTDQAIRWIEDHRRSPFFLFLHYFDPHADYAPPAGYAERFDEEYGGPSVGEYAYLRSFEKPGVPLPEETKRQVIALYDGEIRYTDDQIERVLDLLRQDGRLDDTIVAVFSDHGEEFKEHGSFGHGGTLYSEVTRVPMILRYGPRVPAGTRVESPTMISDLPALITSLAGLSPVRQFFGESAAPIPILEELAGESGPHRERELILETTREGPKRFAVLRGGLAYVSPSRYARVDSATADGALVQNWIPIPEGLYRIEDDPLQQDNVLDLEKGAAELARAAIRRYVHDQVRGLRLVCRGPDDGTARIEGTIQFDARLLDDPFGYNLGEGDKVVPLGAGVTSLRSDHYGLELELGNDDKGVIFVPDADSGQARVSLLRDGTIYHNGVVPLPPPGEVVPLGNGSGGAGCRLEGGNPPLGRPTGTVSLTDEQVERLESLGYLR